MVAFVDHCGKRCNLSSVGIQRADSLGYAGAVAQDFPEYPLRNTMNTELTEEEMRQALFGVSEPVVSTVVEAEQDPVAQVAIPPKAEPKKALKPSKSFNPRLRVTLRVGNEFEGQVHEIVHEADTLSSLLAEQEATKAARKKYRFVEVVSVKSM